MEFYRIIDIITLIISLALFLLNVRTIKFKRNFIIYLFVFLFYVFPLFLDYVIAFPTYDYSKMIRGFDESYLDSNTRIIYDIGILITQFFILYYRRKNLSYFNYSEGSTEEIKMKLKPVLLISMVFPTIATLLLPGDKSILYLFQWREYSLASMSPFYGLLEQISYIGISSALFLMFDNKQKKSFILLLICFLFIYVNMCIQGKRSISFFAILNIVIIYLPGIRKKQTDLKRNYLPIVMISIFAFVFMLSQTMNVQSSRGMDVGNRNVMYTITRVDFLRDDRVRTAIYAELYPEKMTMLDYRGETLLTLPIRLFPINYLFKNQEAYLKSYTRYLSAAIEKVDYVNVIPNMTPAIYAELISNFGLFLGIVFFPVLCLLFVRWTDKYPYPFNGMILVSFVLMQMYDMRYILWYLEFVYILCLVYKNKTKRAIIRD